MVQLPIPSNSKTFFFSPKDAKEVYFLFLPLSESKEELAFLCSVITTKDNNLIRVEPRYYDQTEFKEYLKILKAEPLFDLLLEALSELEDGSMLEPEILQKLSNQSVLEYEKRDVQRYLEEGGSIYDYSDYSTCGLFCYEPRTILAGNEELVKKAMNILREILGEDRFVSNKD